MARSKTVTTAGSLRSIGTRIIGFVLTGYVFHGLTASDIRRLDASTVSIRLCHCGLFLAALAWFVFVVPSDIAILLVGIPFALVGMKASLFVIQWLIVTYLETNQYLGATSDVAIHEYVFGGVRNGLGSENRDGTKHSR